MKHDVCSSTHATIMAILLAILLPSVDLCYAQIRGGAEMSVEGSTNFPGLDYNSFDMGSASYDQCAQACLDDPLCKAFTYVQPGYQSPKARCCLKSGVSSKEPNECCVSGVKVENAADNMQAAQGFTVGGTQRLQQAIVPEISGLEPMLSLTGVWECTDGGLYYLTQHGNIVAWFAQSRYETDKWAQVGWGTANYGTLNMEWMDIPSGTRRAHGTMSIQYTNDMMNTLQSDSGYKRWVRYSGMSATPIQLPGPVADTEGEPIKEEEEA